MSNQYVSTEWLNLVIRGKVTFRKCPSCDKDGLELQYYNEDGDPCLSTEESAWRSMCEDCDGIGYLQNVDEL